MAGYPFETMSADIDETFDRTLTVEQNVMEISSRKADVAATLLGSQADTVILAADTTVVLDGIPLGKPGDAEHAVAMLSSLQGRSHEVLTGYAIRHYAKRVTGCARTLVSFEPMDAGEIRRYIDTMKPFDKAGAYGIQDPILACYVSGIEGCYYNVVGLPVSRVCADLKPFMHNGHA
jgi:septum formation protein